MALVKCKECGKEISIKASKCPNCGCTITSDTVIVNCSICGKEISKEDYEDYDERCINCYIEKLSNDKEFTKEPKITEEKPRFSIPFLIYLIVIPIIIYMLTLYKDITSFNFFAFTCIFITFWFVPFYIYYTDYSMKVKFYNNEVRAYNKFHANKNDYLKEKIINRINEIKKYREESRKEELYSDSETTCPNCGSTNIKEISTASRVISVGIFGLASGKIGKTYECNSCKYKW